MELYSQLQWRLLILSLLCSDDGSALSNTLLYSDDGPYFQLIYLFPLCSDDGSVLSTVFGGSELRVRERDGCHFGQRRHQSSLWRASPQSRLGQKYPQSHALLRLVLCVRLHVCVCVSSKIIYRSARIIRCGGAKSMAAPPTAQTPGPNWLKFFVEAPQEDTFRGIGGIFEFYPRSQDNELFVAHFRVFSEGL